MTAVNGGWMPTEPVQEKRPSLLTTKLYIPRQRKSYVNRPQLVEKLQAGLTRKLTLVSAPAGFGKSSLLSACAIQCDRPVAWVALDRRDNDPVRFWAYFFTALQTIRPDLGEGVVERWHRSPPPFERILTDLINELAQIAEPTILVLDDFHVINAEPVHDGLIFLLTHLPPSLHLIVSSRADPPWPLARWRVRREINEIRAQDLRFSLAETAVFLNNVMGLNLSQTDVAVLDERTEGWIAGLQMAAMSLQNQDDPAAFIRNFSASNRFVLDYLVEEVFDQQPAAIQEFLLQTSVLERMSAPLCTAVTGRDDSQAILTQLAQSNLFLVPLDDERRWYRYHHLFAEVLSHRLQQIWPDTVPDLHGRASRWFEGQALADEAVTQALAAGDMNRAATLVEQYTFEVMKYNQEMTLAAWMDALSEEAIRKRPWLCVHKAYINQWIGRREEAEPWLCWAEEAANAMDLSAGLDKDRLTGHIAARRAHSALVMGDVANVIVQTQRALAALPETDNWRMVSLIALGGAYWAKGDVRQSEEIFAQASAGGRQMGDRSVAVLASCYAGLQQEKQGRLAVAHQTYEDALAFSSRRDGQKIASFGFPLIRLANLWREWNDLDKAGTYLNDGLAICVGLGQSDIVSDAYIVEARLHLALGQPEPALAALQNARQVMENTLVDPWLEGWLDACYLEYWLRQGEWETAVHWFQTSGLTIDDPLSYHHDLHHLNLARLLVTQGRQEPNGPYLTDALVLLERLQTAAEQAAWIQETIKIMILQAVALQAASQPIAALKSLTQAVTLARPGGYVRLFVDEGTAVAEMLAKLPDELYVKQLLMAFDNEASGTAVIPAPPPSFDSSPLIDPLSERELEVLRFLKTHLSSTEIAEELYVAPSTVRSHIKNIYSKLDVHSRADAVACAEMLHLFS